jgi:hypothetical protein
VGQPRGRGEAWLIRDADDDAAAFQEQAGAEPCSRELGPRLGTCGLAVAPDKKRGIPFSGQPARGRTSVDVLGVECRGGTTRAGQPQRNRRQRRSDTWPGVTERLRHCQVDRPRLVGGPPRVTSAA